MFRTTAPDVMPILSAGRHRSAARGACFMEYASFLAGERWSDHPACTDPALAALARDVNDLTPDEHRDALLPYVSRVVGLRPDDDRITAELAVIAACAALPVASMERQRALAAGLLSLSARVGDAALQRRTADALESVPDAHAWARRFVDRAIPSRSDWRRASFAMIHTAVVGIALACVPDAPQRLRELLRSAIETVESRMPAPSRSRTREAALLGG